MRPKTTTEADAEHALAVYRQIAAMQMQEGWRIVLGWLRDAIQVRKEILCDDLDQAKTAVIRGEILFIRGLLAKMEPDPKVAEMAEIELQQLRAKADGWHTLRTVLKQEQS